MPRLKVQFWHKDNSMEGQTLKEAVVSSPSEHPGEIEQAIADHIGERSYFNITVRKWSKA
jgi:hypothetical protein